MRKGRDSFYKVIYLLCLQIYCIVGAVATRTNLPCITKPSKSFFAGIEVILQYEIQHLTYSFDFIFAELFCPTPDFGIPGRGAPFLVANTYVDLNPAIGQFGISFRLISMSCLGDKGHLFSRSSHMTYDFENSCKAFGIGAAISRLNHMCFPTGPLFPDLLLQGIIFINLL